MNKLSFMHYRNHRAYTDEIDCRGGATVAIMEQENKDAVLVSIARCHDNDVFDRKMGRVIASGRIQAYVAKGRNSSVYSVTVPEGTTVKDAVNDWVVSTDQISEFLTRSGV